MLSCDWGVTNGRARGTLRSSGVTIRLGEYLVEGTMYSKGNYGVHGFLWLRGEEEDEEPMALRFEVTGDPGPDLYGKHIRFAL